MSDRKKTRSQRVAEDVAALLRARNPLIWVVTREEGRAERYLGEAGAAAGFVPRTWDVAQGVVDLLSTKRASNMGSPDPSETLKTIEARSEAEMGTDRGVWIMRDLPAWLSGPLNASTLRQLRNLARSLPATRRDSAQAVIVLTPSTEIPPELAGHATVIEWPLPDRDEIAAVLDAAIEGLPEPMQSTAAPNDTRDAAIDAAVGLTGEEAAACFAKSLVQLRRIDPVLVAQEKQRIIARERVLEWFEPLRGGLDAVGGLENLKTWLTARRAAYSPRARAYGLPAPKGVLLVGVPGCGKSLLSKAIATAWGVPLLRLDLGALRSKFVGESEGNLRRALRVIEAIGRCVVWLDEIEKAMQGATAGAADGGVSADALGAILSWMQERQGEAFVVATANDAESLPPELMRKGRFDEVWWVDLPTLDERASILAAAVRSHARDPGQLNLELVATSCPDFTGAEIAALVPEAMFSAFADAEREITDKDLLEAAKTVVPLSRTAADKIARLREWAKTRARPASKSDETKPAKRAGRQIDL